jgi:hypothetical protein
MKTTSFGKINIRHEVDGEVILEVSSPSDGTVSLSMTPDEVMLFLVEVGNGLALARRIELSEKIKRNQLRENRR